MATCTDDGWLNLIDPGEAEEIYQQTKLNWRAHEVAYKAERERLIGALVASRITKPRNFGEWIYEDGQEGGYFYRPTRPDFRVQVAAFGALEAAKEMLSDPDDIMVHRPARIGHR